MDVFIDPNRSTGLAEQIYDQIRGEIVEGRLTAGDRLPPTRELAAILKVSRHTVTTAFGRLSAEGYLEGRRGGGTVVSDFLIDIGGAGHRGLSPANPNPSPGPPVTHDLRVGTPDPRLFPATDWKRAVRWAVDQRDSTYGDPAGSAEVRIVLARWIGRSRGVDAGFRELMVTSGAQQALYLVARICAGQGEVVAVEDPGYLPFRRILESIGASIVPIPVDDEGIIVDAIPTAARLVYVTPSHQFPTGVTMSMRRRTALLALARRHEMTIIEDDYDSEYRYVDRPLEPLFRLDRDGLVVYVGTFSKVLSPALRLGFAVVPPWLIGAVLEMRRLIDWSPPTIDQLTLRSFLADGHLDRHLRRTRRVYERRYRQLVTLLEWGAERGVLEPSLSNAGLHVAARLTRPDTESEVVGKLAGSGVAVEAFDQYSLAPSSGGGLVFGFGLINEEGIGQAKKLIETALIA